MKIDCIVYVASKMTGRDRAEQIKRAYFVKWVLEKYDLQVISPIIEEHVEAREGQLQNTQEDLRRFWKRDKELICNKAHVVLFDEAERKSFGMEREYCFSRGVLWKPSIICTNQNSSVACFEDDFIAQNPWEAAQYIVLWHGTKIDRIMWRVEMLIRTLPKWIWRQIKQWR